jgi:hypothetical protein
VWTCTIETSFWRAVLASCAWQSGAEQVAAASSCITLAEVSVPTVSCSVDALEACTNSAKLAYCMIAMIAANFMVGISTTQRVARKELRREKV